MRDQEDPPVNKGNRHTDSDTLEVRKEDNGREKQHRDSTSADFDDSSATWRNTSIAASETEFSACDSDVSRSGTSARGSHYEPVLLADDRNSEFQYTPPFPNGFNSPKRTESPESIENTVGTIAVDTSVDGLGRRRIRYEEADGGPSSSINSSTSSSEERTDYSKSQSLVAHDDHAEPGRMNEHSHSELELDTDVARVNVVGFVDNADCSDHGDQFFDSVPIDIVGRHVTDDRGTLLSRARTISTSSSSYMSTSSSSDTDQSGKTNIQETTSSSVNVQNQNNAFSGIYFLV